jgi:hypothetical protein
MGENKRRFRFLTDEEYGKLASEERGPYLQAAAKELEWRQQKLRELVQELITEHRMPPKP